jgi:DNA-binding NarL/FixJ family response regulator
VTRQPEAPRYVVTNTTDADAVLRRLARDGWIIRDGFALPEGSWDVSDARLLLHGHVTDPDSLHLAVLAAARGAGILAITDPTSGFGQALIDDLGRLGAVTQDSTPAAADLADEQRALLERLAAGHTIAAAAAAEFLSLRTANRRIAEARAQFGVSTTREAVLAYLRQRKPE